METFRSGKLMSYSIPLPSGETVRLAMPEPITIADVQAVGAWVAEMTRRLGSLVDVSENGPPNRRAMMLSNEKRPVETIATDANGLPRWVMCHWPGRQPERALLLLSWQAHAKVWSDGTITVISRDLLHEIPADRAKTT